MLVWTALTWLSMGCLRKSELLGTDNREFDAVKIMRWNDIKLMEDKVGTELTTADTEAAKNLKWSPVQLIGMPCIGGFHCPELATEEEVCKFKA